jgi:hypothetical protein
MSLVALQELQMITAQSPQPSRRAVRVTNSEVGLLAIPHSGHPDPSINRLFSSGKILLSQHRPEGLNRCVNRPSTTLPMHSLHRTIASLALTLSLATAASGVTFKPAFPNLTIKKPVTTAIIPGTDRELIVAQGGVIYELPKKRAAKEAAIWFDLRDRVTIDKDFEEGLLGLAFHPKYKSNDKFYVYQGKAFPELQGRYIYELAK